jgi:glycosyltransferase involved in cell wall biosynthesis
MRIGLFTERASAIPGSLPATVDAVVAHRPHDASIHLYCGAASLVALRHTRDIAVQAAADRIDVVHLATTGPMAITALLIASRFNLPVVASLPPRATTAGNVHRTYLRVLVRRCRKLLVTSMTARTAFLRAGVCASKLIVWRPGVDTSMYTASKRSVTLRERWEVSDSRPAVIYAGEISDDRGAQRLLSLELELHRTRPMHRLIVAGDGRNRDELQARCPNAIFMGQVPPAKMPELLASGDLFVCPNETNSTNLAVLEAQACGLPVVLMERGSARERVSLSTSIVCRSQADFIVETAALIRTGERRRAMGFAARDHAARQAWQSGLISVYAEYRAAAEALRLRRDLEPAFIPQGRRF